MMLKGPSGLLRNNNASIKSDGPADVSGSVSSTHFNKNILQEAQEKIQEFTVRAVCGREYVRTEALKIWLTTEVSKRARVRRIADASTRNHNPRLLLSKHQILDRGDPDCCLDLFSILLEIGFGHLLRPLESQGIRDKKLPVTLHELQRQLEGVEFPSDKAVPLKRELAEKINRVQWRYRPVRFELGMSEKSLSMDYILPICRKQKISETATATFYQIQVQEEFVGEKLRQLVPQSRFCDEQYGQCYHFTIKSFVEGYREQFDDEREMFMHLQDHDSVLRYLGDYIQWGRFASQNPNEPNMGKGLEAPQTSYNILFEYADYDLGSKLQTKSPPFLPSGIFKFWRFLFEFVNAIEKLHEYTMTVGRQLGKSKNWQPAVKPESILSVDGKFKLADVEFVAPAAATDAAAPLAMRWHTYGSPERHMSLAENVDLTFPSDIWALGCLFSIVATWMVLSKSGVSHFHRVRQRAIQKIIFSQLWDKRGSGGVQFGTPHDFFHNGQEILPVVKEWHALLRKIHRAGDPLTGRVLDLAENRMLLSDQHERITAKQLVSELSEMVHLDKEPKEIISDDIHESLLAIEHEEEERAIIMKHYRSRSVDFTIRSEGDADSGSVHSQQMGYERRRSSAESRLSEASLSPPAVDQLAARNDRSPSLKPEDLVMNAYFKAREVIFVVDNGATMTRHWPEVNKLLGELAMRVAGSSDIMPKFLFTRDLTWMTFKQVSSTIIAKMMGVRRPQPAGQTDMAKAFAKVAEDYVKGASSGGRGNARLNPLTVIVLTDCIWQATRVKDDVLNPIKTIADKINSQPQSQAKLPLRVEFVQYGTSSTVTEMLRRFKQNAIKMGMENVIESDPSTEEHKKILLGQFEDSIDHFDLTEQIELPSVHQAPDPSSGRVLTLPKLAQKGTKPAGLSQGVTSSTRISLPQRSYSAHSMRPGSPGGSSPGSPLTPIREESMIPPGYGKIEHEVKKAFDSQAPKLPLDAPLKAKITVAWELTRCLTRMLGGSSNLASTLTITGDPVNACAFPCEQYLNMTWNGVGMCVLEGLQESLQKDGEWTAISCPQGPSIRSMLHHDQGEGSEHPEFAEFQVNGTLHNIISVSQVLAWLAATFRVPAQGHLCNSQVDFTFVQESEFRISLRELSPILLETPTSGWQTLFQNHVLATGFPIPIRPKEMVGLHIDFHTMAHLAGILYHVDVSEMNAQEFGIYFKGKSTILFPTGFTDDRDGFQWNLLNHGQKPMKSAVVFEQRWARVQDLDMLRSATAYLA